MNPTTNETKNAIRIGCLSANVLFTFGDVAL